MTETPEFSGCPELHIRRGFKSFMKPAEAEVANELLWVISGLVDRINA
jgi:hypothetical protein